jgi:hypothetical protein
MLEAFYGLTLQKFSEADNFENNAAASLGFLVKTSLKINKPNSG